MWRGRKLEVYYLLQTSVGAVAPATPGIPPHSTTSSTAAGGGLHRRVVRRSTNHAQGVSGGHAIEVLWINKPPSPEQGQLFEMRGTCSGELQVGSYQPETARDLSESVSRPWSAGSPPDRSPAPGLVMPASLVAGTDVDVATS